MAAKHQAEQAATEPGIPLPGVRARGSQLAVDKGAEPGLSHCPAHASTASSGEGQLCLCVTLASSQTSQQKQTQVSPTAVASASLLCLPSTGDTLSPWARGDGLTAAGTLVHRAKLNSFSGPQFCSGDPTSRPNRIGLCKEIITWRFQCPPCSQPCFSEQRGEFGSFWAFFSQQLRNKNNWKLQMSGQEWKIILTRPECQAISTSEVTCWSLYVKIPEAEKKKKSYLAVYF